MDWVWETELADPTDTLLLLRLAKHASDSGDHCFPSLQHLAEMTRHSERQVQRSLARLRADGWITTKRRGRGQTSMFVLNVTKLQTAHEAAEKARQMRRSEEEKHDADDVSRELRHDTGDVSTESRGDTGDVFSESSEGMTRHGESADTTPEHIDTTPMTQKHDVGVTQKGHERSNERSDEILEASPREIDPRFGPFKEKYLQWFKSMNNGLEDSWTGKEGDILNQLLKTFPTLNFEHWKSVLANRARSNVSLSEPFSKWGFEATLWVSGPHHKGYVSQTQLTARSIRVSRMENRQECGTSLEELFDALNGKKSVIEGQLADGRAALPAPAEAPRVDGTGANGHKMHSAAPTGSAAPGLRIADSKAIA